MNKNFQIINNVHALKYYQLNKFFYKATKKLPFIKKINLSFDQQSTEFKQITMSNLALEILFFQKSISVSLRKSNLVLKVKKGQPTGCKLTFNTCIKTAHALKIIFEVLETNKYNINLKLNKQQLNNSITTSIPEIYNFKKLETHFLFFNKLKKLNFSLITSFNNSNKKEITFLIFLFC